MRPVENEAEIAARKTEENGEAVSKLARTAFVILFAMNLLDYIDRWTLSAVLQDVQREFAIDNTRAGLLTTYFLISYSLLSPLTGWLGDRMRRTRILGIGVAIWSLSTIGSGLAASYGQLAIVRACLGVGEACYGVLAPTILMDLFPRERRARVMSTFYIAMPLGGALGYFLGAWIAKITGSWRWSFFIVGAPGLLAAFASLLLPEPVRGASEGVDEERLKTHEKSGPSKEDYVDMMVNSSYTYSVFGMAMYTFAIGGLAVWFPKFLTFTRGMDKVWASSMVGLVTGFASIIGMSAGGWISDKLAKTNPKALFIVPGLAMLASIPFVLVGLLSTQPVWIFGGIFLAEMLMFINTGPCSAIIANVVAPNMRAVAYAVSIFAVHFLGDIWSPPLMGFVADQFGDPEVMRSWLGGILRSIGAVPVTDPESKAGPQNMLAGMLVVVPAIFLSGTVLLAGARHLPREMALMLAKLKAAPGASKPSRS